MKKFFRIMKRPQETWEPYSNEPMYDEHPELGSYRSTNVSHPRVNDYLIQKQDGSIYPERPSDFEYFDGVRFGKMPSLRTLLEAGIIAEVPKEIMEWDYRLQWEMKKIGEECSLAEDALSSAEMNMREKKFGFPTKFAREERKYYMQIKPKVDELNKKYAALADELQKKVINPLTEVMQTERHPEEAGDYEFNSDDNLPKVIPVKNLPEGWQWVKYNDGSGHLKSPNGDHFFQYDLTSYSYADGVEFKETITSGWSVFWGRDSFWQYAEKTVQERYLLEQAQDHTYEPEQEPDWEPEM